MQRKRRLLHTTIKGIKSMQLSSHRAALNGWCAHVAESRRLEKLLEHSLSTVRHAKASKVWRQWRAVLRSGQPKKMSGERPLTGSGSAALRDPRWHG